MPTDPVGTWAVRADGQPLMMLTIGKDGSGWHADWRRPAHFDADFDKTASMLFNLHGGTIDLEASAARRSGDALELHFPPATNGGDRADMTFRTVADGTARFGSNSVPTSALVLDRAAPGEQPIRPDANETYVVDEHHHWSTNPEMTSIFDADQADRGAGAGIDWSIVAPRDDARRKRTKALLDTGKLQSGTDFWHAAFVFQHGEDDDYLLAHALATIAIARGRPDATWIAAATLDRYLQAHDLKQVYGTQFLTRDGKTTQDPYNRTLLSDALRQATGVPDQSEQEKRRQQFQAEFGKVPLTTHPKPTAKPSRASRTR